MTYYLRNADNESIVDIELMLSESVRDLRTVIVIDIYSKFLLSGVNKREIIQDFYNLSELRGWFHETQYYKKDDIIISNLESILLDIAKKYNLLYVTD